MSQRTTEFAAKITGDADGALAALEKVKVRVRDTAAAAASANTAIGNSTGLLVKNSEKAAKGVAAITQALYALEADGSSRVLALGGAVGAFADLLGPGGKVVSGIAIVASSIVALFLQAKEKSAEATKAIEDDLKRLVNAGDFAAITKRLQDIERGTAGDGFNDGRSAIRQRIAALTDEAAAVGKTSRFYRERQEKIIAEKAKLEDLNAEYDRYLKALTNPATGAQGARGLAGQPITSTADSDEAIARRSKANTDAAQKAAEAFKKAYSDSLIAVQSAIVEADRELAELQASGIKRLGEESKARADGNAELQAQVIALGQGRAAYEELLIVQAQAAELSKAEAVATAAKLTLTAKQIEQIKVDVRERARLLNVAKALQALIELDGKSPFDIPETFDRVGDLAERMSMVASAAQGIAAAFGEVGRNIAGVLGQTSQLLTNLQRAQRSGIFTDLNGKEQNVGFLGALTGKAGAAGSAAAISSTLGVVGAVVSIGSALSTFGAESRQRARELLRLAEEFNASLGAFARNLDDQALSQAAQSRLTVADDVGALVEKFFAKIGQAVPEGFRATEKELRNWIDGLLGHADRLREEAENADGPTRTGLLNRANALAGFASELAKIADQAKRAEAALKAQQVTDLARRSEDLRVSLLRAKGDADGADALERQLQLQRDIREVQSEFEDVEGLDAYIAALQEVRAAETAAAAETRRRATILQRLSDDDTFLGGTTVERFRRSFAALGESFTDFAGVFAGFDTSTRAGLEGAKAKVREIYESLAADGISEAERPIIDFLRSLLGNIDAAIGELPEILDPIATALEAFGERVSLFGTSLPDQLSELRAIFSGKFGDLFDEILTSADLGTDDGRAAFKAAIAAQLDAILSDGVISESERAFYDVLVRFFGIANDAIADADAEATEAVEAAAARRQARRTTASNRIDLRDLTGTDAFNETLAGFGSAFADLFRTFDIGTLEGITRAKAMVRGLFDELTALSDEEILKSFGLTRDEMVAALLDTDNGLDGLKGTLKDVAEAALDAAKASAEFADSIQEEFLRSQGRGQDADILAAQRRRDERLKQAGQLGVGGAFAKIEAIYQADLAEIAAKYAPEVTAAAEPASTASPTSAAAAEARARSPRRNTTVVGDFGGLSEITAQSLAGLLREIAINTSESGAIVSALIGRGALRPLSSLSFPSLPSGGAGAGGIVIGSISVSIGSINPAGLSVSEAGSATAREIARQLGRLVGQETRFLGSGVA